MDWAKDGKGNRNPIVLIDGDKSINVITKKAVPGESVAIDASSTFDPDGDSLSFKWWVQPEAGTYFGDVSIQNSRSNIATIVVPKNSTGKNFHLICEVTDNGIPKLTSYRRIIIESFPDSNQLYKGKNLIK